jgi:hypothetical protein
LNFSSGVCLRSIDLLAIDHLRSTLTTMTMLPWPSVRASWPDAEEGRWKQLPVWLKRGRLVWMFFYYGIKGFDETTGFEAGVVESIDMEQQRVIVAFPKTSRMYFTSFADAAKGELFPAADLQSSRSPADDDCFANRDVLHAAGKTVICRGDVFILDRSNGIAFQVQSSMMQCTRSVYLQQVSKVLQQSRVTPQCLQCPLTIMPLYRHRLCSC